MSAYSYLLRLLMLELLFPSYSIVIKVHPIIAKGAKIVNTFTKVRSLRFCTSGERG